MPVVALIALVAVLGTALMAVLILGGSGTRTPNASAIGAVPAIPGQSMTIKTPEGSQALANVTDVGTDVTIPNTGVCTYAANDPATQQGNFGPTQGHFNSANEAIASLAQAMADDCYLAAIWTTVDEEWSSPEVVTAIANGQTPPDLNEARVQELAQKFKDDPKAWHDAIQSFFENNKDMVLMEAPDVAYYSLGQNRGANPGDMPQVTLLAEHQSLTQALMIRKGGQNWVADRLPCRHQPSVPGKPRIVPAPPRQAPPAPPAPPRVLPPPPALPPPPVVCNNCRPTPPPPVCNNCRPTPPPCTTCGCLGNCPPPPPPPCTTCGCLGNCPPPPPPCTTCGCLGNCPNDQKIPTQIPGNGGAGDGGRSEYGAGGAPPVSGPATAPEAGPPPAVYQQPAAPVEQQAPAAPVIVPQYTPPAQQQTVDPGYQSPPQAPSNGYLPTIPTDGGGGGEFGN
ncbi:MAG: hypothetical protein JWN75_753 [Candidatus Saccharibacteria bacterium]|nr:hypothetical protein [Candidatus Saccharibacteria bacterium]